MNETRTSSRSSTKKRFIKSPVAPKASSPRTTSEKSCYSFRPYRDTSEGMSQTATFATPPTNNPENEMAFFGNRELKPLHHQQDRLGGSLSGTTIETTPFGGYPNDSSRYASEMNHLTAVETAHGETRGNGRDSQAGTCCGTSNPFAPDINVHPAQPMLSYNPHMPAAYNLSAHPKRPTHGGPSHGFNLTCPHPSHLQGAAVNHHLPSCYSRPWPPPPYPAQNLNVPSMHYNNFHSERSGTSTQSYDAINNRGPWNAVTKEENVRSAPGQRKGYKSGARGNDGQTRGWGDVRSSQNNQARPAGLGRYQKYSEQPSSGRWMGRDKSGVFLYWMAPEPSTISS